MPFRIIAGVLGAFFLVQGLGWLVTPESASEGLSMPLLDGAARSTQIGDISAFFLCIGGFALAGSYLQNATLVRAAGCLIGIPAVTRTIAWAFHDAPFTTLFITIELVAGTALLLAAARMPPAPATHSD